MTTRLRRVELEGFRGFAAPQALDLDADAIVIRGDNGTGKTSLIDGLLWLFTGKLAHLVERVRGLRRTEDAVRSRFNTQGATVALTIDVDGVEHIFTRSGGERETKLSARVAAGPVLVEEPAETLLASVFGFTGVDDFRHAISAWGLLRQDAVRASLDEAGGALHERVAGLIGLERVSAFASAASRASGGLVRQRTDARSAQASARQRHSEAVARRDAASQAAGSQADVASMLQERLAALTADIGSDIELRVPDQVALSDVAAMGAAVARVVESLAALERHQSQLREFPGDGEPLLAAATSAVARAEQAAQESAQRAPALIQLASSALTLIGQRCPVCEQEIDEASVRRHLEEVLEGSRALAADAQRTQDKLANAQAELAQVRQLLDRRRLAAESLEAARAELKGVVADVEPHLRVKVDDLGPQATQSLAERLTTLLGGLRELYRIAREASGAEVARLADAAEEAARALATATEELVALEARCDRTKVLEKAAHRVAERMLDRALDELQPSFSEVFDRLSPNPAFTELLARQDVMRNRNQVVPMVRDRERGIDANPMLVFSEGQLNVVALSYFLGMALNASDAALPFLVLDDPLQSLDVIAILGFSDLCRHIRDRRQLLVTTHDRRFADILVRKLSPRDEGQTLIVHEFEGWRRDGPEIRSERPGLQPVMRLLRGEAS